MSDQSDPDADAADAPGVAVGGVTDDAQGTAQIDGEDVELRLSDEIVEAVEATDDVTLEDVAAAAAPDGDQSFSIAGAADADDTLTIPVHDQVDLDLSRSGTEGLSGFDFIGNDRIQKLEKNSVDYTEDVGDWILSRDDLVPAVKERLKALIMGEDGLEVDAEDPDSEADQRLAEHMQDVYGSDVRPTAVIDTILTENLKNSRVVLRSTDLMPLDLETLDFIRDGVTGEEIYWQSDTRVTTFDIPDDGDVDDVQDIDLDVQDIDGQPLVIGDHVFDVRLYERPPLEAVADTVVNKKQMQRLKARKAEITSFGAIYAKVNPPDYLPEDEYFDYVEDDDGNQITKLERAMRQGISQAFDWLKDYQSGTTGAIPMHWDLEQLQMPEGDEPLDDQIRGYNRDISRRLLVPIDLIELREGAELSRETLMRTLLTTIQGWRQELLRVFDQYADVQADIHDLDGNVEHSFPPLNEADVEAITSLLQYAGVLGATSDELRQMVNQIQGVDLPIDQRGADTDTDDDGTGSPDDLPPSGGPADPDDREGQMATFLDDQDGTDATATRRSALEAASDWSEGDKVETPDGDRGVVVERRTEDFTGPSGDEVDASDDEPAFVVATEAGSEVFRASELTASDWGADVDDPATDLAKEVEAAAVDLEADVNDWDYPDSWEEATTPARLILLDAWSSMGGQFDCGGGCCKGTMMSSGMGDRASDQFCASMKDRVLQWEGWRGADVTAQTLTAAYDFHADSLRDAAQKIRQAVEGQIEAGQTVRIQRRGDDRMAVVIYEPNGDIAGTLMVQRSSTSDRQFVVTGTDDFFEHLTDFRDQDGPADAEAGGLIASIRAKFGL